MISELDVTVHDTHNEVKLSLLKISKWKWGRNIYMECLIAADSESEMLVTSAAHYDPKWESAWYICENNAWWLLAQVDRAGAGCAGCQQVFILDVTSHIASWQLAQEVIIAFAALILHLCWKHWEASLCLRRAFSRAASCCPRAACGTRVLFSILVASSSLAVCSRDARARGQGASGIDREGCVQWLGGTPFPGSTFQCHRRGGGVSTHQ